MIVKRRNKEPSEVVVRRFNREIQISGMFTEVKKRRFFSKDISRQLKRENAIRKSARKAIKRGY